MISPSRRSALGRIAAICTASFAGVLWPLRARAAWPKGAFDAKTSKDAIGQLYPGATPEQSTAIRIVAPDLAENGGIVPITVISTLPGIQTITILAEENPRALTSTYTLGARARTPLTVRVKLAKTQDITVVARTADNKVHTASHRITVSVGGCGG
jgi:sulfur-oxidizing protein SoxY